MEPKMIRDGSEARVDGPMFRTFTFTRESVKVDERTVELSFSSEREVERWWGWEILDHGKASVRLGRLNEGGAVMVDHRGDQVGVVDHAEIAADRKGRAVLRFGKGQRAAEVFQDIVDGIRRNVSVSYIIHKMVLEKEVDDVQWFRVMDWEPLEISIVSIPADATVGVGRSAEPEGSKPVEEVKPDGGGKKTMDTKEAITVEQRDAAVKAVRDTAASIMAIGKQHGCVDLATEAIQKGSSVEEFRAVVLEHRYKATPVQTADPKIGLSDKEIKSFSFLRAINAMVTRDWGKAGFERECSDAVAKQVKREAQGCFIPRDVTGRGLVDAGDNANATALLTRMLSAMLSRDLTKGVGSAGGYTVATDLLTANFIELLRNRMMVRRMGATILGGLVGDIAIPSQTGGATTYWVGESGEPTESQQAFGQLGLTPKTVGAFTDISRKLLMQSSIDVEAFVRGDLATILALAMDLAAINGQGAAGEPLGILKTTGIGDVAGGTNGAAPTWPHIVELETDVAVGNADVGTLGYLTNAKARGKLKTTEKATTTGMFIWGDQPGEPGMGSLNGYRAGVSNQVPSDLVKGASGAVCSAIIFGNFADLIIAEWGGLDLLVDPYTGGNAGTVRVRVLQDVDTAIRHAASFSAMQDALTT